MSTQEQKDKALDGAGAQDKKVISESIQQEGAQQQESGEQVQQEQPIMDEQNQQPQPVQFQYTQKERQKYINKLQTLLSKNKQKLSISQQQKSSLQSSLNSMKEGQKKLKFDFLTLKQQLSTTLQESSNKQVFIQQLQEKNKKLVQSLGAYEQIGDIQSFKLKITELQDLIKIQKQQLTLKDKMIDQMEEVGHAAGSDNNGDSSNNKPNVITDKISAIKLIDQYEKGYSSLQEQSAMLTEQLKESNQKLENFAQQRQNQSNKFEQLNQTLIKTTQQYALLQSKLQEQEKFYQEKISQLSQQQPQQDKSGPSHQQQQFLQQNQNQQRQNFNYQIIEERYKIKILTPEEQRDMILKKYIDLELSYNENLEKLESLRERHYKVLKEIKAMSLSTVSKTEYNQLYKRYSKLRKCLENSLINQEILKNKLEGLVVNNAEEDSHPNSQASIQGKMDGTKRFKDLISQQPQNPSRQIQQIVENSLKDHQKSINLLQQISLRQKLTKTQKILGQANQQITNLKGQVAHLNKMLALYDNQIGNKRRHIDNIQKENSELIQKMIKYQKGYVEDSIYQQALRDAQKLKHTSEIYQIKNLQLLHGNNSLKNDKEMLTELYNEMKAMYEQAMERHPHNKDEQIRQQGEKMDLQDSQTANKKANNGKCSQCTQRQAFQEQRKANMKSQQQQTENLGKLYFKEIRQLLTILKKFPKKIDGITAPLEQQKKSITQIKDKFSQAVSVYQEKTKQVEEQRKANEKWRTDQKEKIRQEFQDIRELILNDKLLNSLRRAKSLIEYYESTAEQQQDQDQEQEQDQNQEGGDNSGNNQNEEVGEKKNEEENANQDRDADINEDRNDDKKDEGKIKNDENQQMID